MKYISWKISGNCTKQLFRERLVLVSGVPFPDSPCCNFVNIYLSNFIPPKKRYKCQDRPLSRILPGNATSVLNAFVSQQPSLLGVIPKSFCTKKITIIGNTVPDHSRQLFLVQLTLISDIPYQKQLIRPKTPAGTASLNILCLYCGVIKLLLILFYNFLPFLIF